MSRGGTRTACESALRAIAKALLSRGVGFQPLRVLICVGLIAGACATASAAPLVPQSDGQLLERLPLAPSDPVLRRLRALNGQLTRVPNDLPLTVMVAQGYSELGRVTGDPRYAGYAQAALAMVEPRASTPGSTGLARRVASADASVRSRAGRFGDGTEHQSAQCRGAAYASDGQTRAGRVRRSRGRMPRTP